MSIWASDVRPGPTANNIDYSVVVDSVKQCQLRPRNPSSGLCSDFEDGGGSQVRAFVPLASRYSVTLKGIGHVISMRSWQKMRRITTKRGVARVPDFNTRRNGTVGQLIGVPVR